MTFRSFLVAASTLLIAFTFTAAHADGGLVMGDISQVRKLLGRYAVSDPSNFCLRSMTMADANPTMREEIIREAQRTSDRYNLGAVEETCPARLAGTARPLGDPQPAGGMYQPAATSGYNYNQYPNGYYGTYSNNTVGAYGNPTSNAYVYGANNYAGQQAATGGYYTTQAPAGAGQAAPGGYYSTQAATTTNQAATGGYYTTQASVGSGTSTTAAAATNTSTTMASVGGGGARIAGSHAGYFLGNDLLWAGLGTLVAGGGAAALIGSGTLGGSTKPSTDCDTTYDCDEYYAQYSLDLMNAKTAYRRGFNGDGVTIAFLDTGLDLSHFEFENRSVDGGGYDFVTNQEGQADPGNLSSHGTEVAGVACANRNNVGMHGVAFNCKVMMLRVFDENNISINSFVSAIDYARVNGARIINGSYGPDDAWHAISEARDYQIITAVELEEGAAFRRMIQAGGIVVAPTGNNRGLTPNVGSNPTGPAFIPFIRTANKNLTGASNGAYRDESGAVVDADFSDLEDGFIAVTGLDRNKNLAGYAQPCGVAKNWCMAAYSNDIFTTTKGGSYATVNGTSFAAPQVSGALAVLRQAFPSLTMQEIRQRLFDTAIDLGAAGVDSTFGWGLLNLDGATRPLGVSTLAVSSDLKVGPRYTLSGSNMKYGKAFGIAASSALADREIVFFDRQNAPFYLAMGNVMNISSYGINSEEAVFTYNKAAPRTEIDLGNATKLSYSLSQSNDDDNRLTTDGPKDPSANDTKMRSFTMSRSFSDSLEASVHYKDQEAMMLGFSEADRSHVEHAIAKDGLQNPFAAFASDGYSSIIKTKAFGGTTRVAGFFGHDADDEEAKNFGSQVETAYNLDQGAAAFVSVGTLFEENRVLGSKGDGAFSFGNGTTTIYSGVGTKVELDGNTTFRAAAYAGWTDPSLTRNSLITDASSIVTSSFNASIDQRNVREMGDVLSFGIAQPLRVESGDMSFYIPADRPDQSSRIVGYNFNQDLSASGREMDLEVNYAFPLGDGEDVSAGALYRFDAGHKAGNEDALGVVRWSKKF
jgi:subtilisin family serine protease